MKHRVLLPYLGLTALAVATIPAQAQYTAYDLTSEKLRDWWLANAKQV